jgi:hypothetical protein
MHLLLVQLCKLKFNYNYAIHIYTDHTQLIDPKTLTRRNLI